MNCSIYLNDELVEHRWSRLLPDHQLETISIMETPNNPEKYQITGEYNLVILNPSMEDGARYRCDNANTTIYAFTAAEVIVIGNSLILS